MQTHHLLWTGGWDSTFRVLQLLLCSRDAVQPHYIIDPERPSSGIEIATMEALRWDIARIAPAHRLRSTVITPLERIPRDARIDAAWRELRRIVPIGEQYAWLAAYVRLKGLDTMELCIHRDDKAHKLLHPYVVGCGEDGKWGLTADAPPQYAFFQCFAFPSSI
jgi:hypothetical protein